MGLCANQILGFGPLNSLTSPSPTPCFTMTILTPIPIWIYLITLPLLLLLARRARRKSLAHIQPHNTHSLSPLRRLAIVLYYILSICAILMLTLQIARLALLSSPISVSLLPFQYVGILLACFVHFTNGLLFRIRIAPLHWQILNIVVMWLGSAVMNIVEAVALGKQESLEGTQGVDNGFARNGTEYHVADQVIDVAVLAGVYAVVGLLEAVLAFKRWGWRDGTGGGPRMKGMGDAMAVYPDNERV